MNLRKICLFTQKVLPTAIEALSITLALKYSSSKDIHINLLHNNFLYPLYFQVANDTSVVQSKSTIRAKCHLLKDQKKLHVTNIHVHKASIQYLSACPYKQRNLLIFEDNKSRSRPASQIPH